MARLNRVSYIAHDRQCCASYCGRCRRAHVCPHGRCIYCLDITLLWNLERGGTSITVCSVAPIMLLDVCYDTECCVAYTVTCILPSCLHGCGYCSSPYHLLLHHRRLFTLTYWPFAARNRQRCVSSCGLRRACHLSSPPATDSAGLATGVHGEITVVNVPHYHCWCRLCCHPHG